MEELQNPKAQMNEQEYEQWQRSIPAQVFLNYFHALFTHTEHSDDAFDLHKIAHFAQLEVVLSEEEVESVKRHLINSWNTEYCIRQTADLGDATYQQHALHWTFPQAYYCVEESLRALLRVLGHQNQTPARILSEAGRLVKRKVYPAALSFYAFGEAHHPSIYGLPQGRWAKPALSLAQDDREVQSQLRQFLRTTHRQRSQQVRTRVQSNPQTAIRSQKSGEVLQRFNREHWQQLAWRTGYTTVFHLLHRLVVSASNREIERFVIADIDLTLFNQCLLGLISYVNFVHEAYVAQAVGYLQYEQWLAELPPYLVHGFVEERYRSNVIPNIKQSSAA